MIAAAAFTTVVHVVQLTVARHIDPATFPGYARIFDWRWPSTFYAIDIVAWDVFFGSLCLIGLVGPFANVIGLRTIGILGYTVVFGLTCLPLSRAFNGHPTA